MSFDCSNKGSSESMNNQQSGANATFRIEKSLADLVTFLLHDSNKHPNDIPFVHQHLVTVTRHSQPPHHVWPVRLGWIYWLTNKKITVTIHNMHGYTSYSHTYTENIGIVPTSMSLLLCEDRCVKWSHAVDCHCDIYASMGEVPRHTVVVVFVCLCVIL